MNFALLGDDPACQPLLRAIAQSPQHGLTAVACGEAPGVRSVANWQALLVEPDLSAVIVAGHAPEILEGARGLAREGKPLIVLLDVRQTAAFAYDLWPVEDEGRAVLCPLFSHDLSGDATAIADQQRATGLGLVWFVQLERVVVADANGLLPLADVENALLNDADLLRRLFGNYSRITCVPVGLTERGVAVMNATLAGDGLPEVTWRCSAATDSPSAQLTVTGHRGSFKANLLSASGDDDAVADSALKIVERRLAGAKTRPQWSEVVRAFDVVDASRRSIRRRRTIEIGSEEISEVRQFKSLMTAAGCGVLTYTLLGVIAALVAGSLLDPRDAAQRRAEAAGFIVRPAEFQAGGAELNDEGGTHVKEIAARLWQTTADVIVVPESPDLDAQRQATVETALTAAGASSAERRVITRPLEGVWFQRAMIGVWAIVFGPLVIVLLLQFVGLAARREDSAPRDAKP